MITLNDETVDSYTPPTADGPYTVTITDTDAAGNASATASLAFTLDTIAPDTPTIALVTDSGTAGDGITNTAALTLSDAAAGATRVITLNDETVDSYTPPTEDGAYTVTVTVTDAAGNASATASLEFTLDGNTLNPLLSATSLAAFETALSDFAAQRSVDIPEGMLPDLAGDLMLNLPASVTVSYAATVVFSDGTYADDDPSVVDVAVNDTLTASLSFNMPLYSVYGPDTPWLGDAMEGFPYPEYAFQYSLPPAVSFALGEVDISAAFDGDTSLSMQRLEITSELLADITSELGGSYTFDAIFPGGLAIDTYTVFEIWGGNATGVQDELTGAFTINGQEILLTVVSQTADGPEDFFFGLPEDAMMFASGSDETDGSSNGQFLATINGTPTITYTPPETPQLSADELGAGLTALIGMRTARDTLIENANAGTLAVEHLAAVSEAGSAWIDLSDYPPQFLAGEMLSLTALDRLANLFDAGDYALAHGADLAARIVDFNAAAEARPDFANLTQFLAGNPLVTPGVAIVGDDIIAIEGQLYDLAAIIGSDADWPSNVTATSYTVTVGEEVILAIGLVLAGDPDTYLLVNDDVDGPGILKLQGAIVGDGIVYDTEQGTVTISTVFGDASMTFLAYPDSDDESEFEVAGTGGDDVLFGASDGYGFYTPGAGNDRIIHFSDLPGQVNYSTLSGDEGVYVDLAEGIATLADTKSDTLINITSARGTNQADVFVGGDDDQFYTFTGLAGNDLIIADMARYDRDARFEGGNGGVRVDLATDVPITSELLGGIGALPADLGTALVGQMAHQATDGFGDTDILVGVTQVRGTDQADTLIAGAETVLFRGNGGADTFVLAHGGNLKIADFNVSQDVLNLRDLFEGEGLELTEDELTGIFDEIFSSVTSDLFGTRIYNLETAGTLTLANMGDTLLTLENLSIADVYAST